METIQKSNSYPNYSDAILSKQEIKMRYFLMHDFNVSLKSMLIKYNYEMFEQYFFNSCRQTALFGALVLDTFFPDYSYKVYEAQFSDKLFGNPVTYEHCFIIAKHKEYNRSILIDMARTTNPLVFEPIESEIRYPNIPEYKDMTMLSYSNIPYETIYDNNVIEWLTGLPTKDFLNELLLFIDNYSKSESENKKILVDKLYGYPVQKIQEFKNKNNILI